MKNKGTANICAAVLACIFILAGCGNGNQVVNYEETDRESILEISMNRRTFLL